MEELRSWAGEGANTSPFALPKGVAGRLAISVMRWSNPQREVLDVLGVQDGERVLEVGYGPGRLIRLLARHTGASAIHGVDPSETAREAAIKANRAAVKEGRVVLGLGTAERTGLPDASFDRVVSVNNVAIWPDLDAGLRELRRVVRPGGTVLIAWHGGTAPSRITARLQLTEEQLTRIEDALRRLFSDVARRRLKDLEVFLATR